MSDSITLSPNHGINPAMLCCPLCGEDTGLALMGLVNKSDPQAPRMMRDDHACEKCVTDLNQYRQIGFVILIADDEFEYQERRNKNLSPWSFLNRLAVVRRESQYVTSFIEAGIDVSKGVVWMSSTAADRIGLTEEACK